MPMLSHPAFGPRTALGYVTGGTLLSIWTALYYFLMMDGAPSRTTYFWLAGFFLTGLTFVFLGLVLGPLGRAARQAELPPASAMNAEAAIQHAAATNAPPVAVVAPTAIPTAPVAPAVVAAPAAPAQVAPVR